MKSQFSKWALIRQLNAISRSQTKKFVKKENLLPEHNAPSEKILKKVSFTTSFIFGVLLAFLLGID